MTSHIKRTLREANVARQAEWDADNQIDLAYRGNELAGEVGEACNLIKKIRREQLGIRGSRANLGQLAEELADVVICADLIAMDVGIDLEKAVADKFNATSEKVGLATRLATDAPRPWSPDTQHTLDLTLREMRERSADPHHEDDWSDSIDMLEHLTAELDRPRG